MFDQEIAELLAKLNGAIWRKAEKSNSISTVYSYVLEKVNEIQNPEGLEGLTVLGEIGGWMAKKYGRLYTDVKDVEVQKVS